MTNACVVTVLVVGQTDPEDEPYVAPDIPYTDVVKKQAFIWVSLTLAFALLMTMCILCRMDPDKSQDTLLYAKFLAEVDKKSR